MPSPDDDQPDETTETTESSGAGESGAVTDGDEDPTERADDGMAPFIANTGDDDAPGDDADASTG